MTAILFILPLVLATVILLSLGIYSRRFSSHPIQLPFECMMYLASAWAITYALDIASDSLAIKIILMQVRFLAVPFIPVLLLLMAILFSGHGAWLSKRRTALLFVIPSFTAFLALTTSLSPLFRYNYYLVQAASGFSILGFSPGTWSMVIYLPFSYCVEVVAGLLILGMIVGAREIYTRQAVLFFIALFVPALVEFLFFAGITPVPGYNLTPSVFAISGVLFSVAIFHYRFLDIAPIARATLFERMADPMFVLDRERRVVDFNPAAARLPGMTLPGTIGTEFSVLFGKWPGFPDGIPGIAGTERTVSIGSGADAKSFDVTFEGIGTGPAVDQGHLVILRDITKRRLAEEALRQQTDAMEAAMDGMALLNRDQEYTYMNKAHARIYGYDNASELIGASWRILYDTSELQWFEQEIMPGLEKKGHYQGRATGRKKDGSMFPQELSLTALEDGRLICVVRDITERKQAEDTLKESEDRFRAISEYSHNAICIIDEKAKILWVNDKMLALGGYSREQVYAVESFVEFIAPESIGFVVSNFSKFLAFEPYEHHYSFYIVRADGEKRLCEKHMVDIVDTHGKRNLIISMLDITERKLAEDTLIRVNQKLNVISQLTRKDLTNQVFVLNSYLELAKNQLAGQDRIIETLQKGVDAIRLIHETIEYSKDYQDMGAKPPKWQNVKMALLFGLSHISIGEVQHSLETENLEIYADPLLEKVCQRLFENSVAHGGHVTRVRVWHRVTPGGVTIIFEDNGVGIPHEKKEQIFLRGDGTRASMRSLVFVREILDITGITIRETGEPGNGARFELSVPKGMCRITGNRA